MAALMLVICMLFNLNVGSVSAANDVEANAYGFNVDNSVYKSTVWYNTVTKNVKSNGKIIGVNNWNPFSGYDTYGKYSYNESIQRMHYTIKTGKSKYTMSMHVIPKFEEMDGVGYWTFTKKKFFECDCTISFTTPY